MSVRKKSDRTQDKKRRGCARRGQPFFFLVRKHARPSGLVLKQDSQLRLALIDTGATKETEVCGRYQSRRNVWSMGSARIRL